MQPEPRPYGRWVEGSSSRCGTRSSAVPAAWPSLPIVRAHVLRRLAGGVCDVTISAVTTRPGPWPPRGAVHTELDALPATSPWAGCECLPIFGHPEAVTIPIQVGHPIQRPVCESMTATCMEHERAYDCVPP